MVKALGEPALQKIYKLLLQEKQVCESLSVHMSTPLGAGLTSPFRLNTLGGYSTWFSNTNEGNEIIVRDRNIT